MATTTPNYGLRKPARADLVNVITDLNDNMDILDGVVLDNDNRPIVVPLDTVTNVSGSYTHTTTISTANLVTSRMKAIKLELADPSVFRDKIIVTVADDEVTLSCDDVVGTSDVTVTLMRVTPLASAEFHPPYMTSDEFDEMAARVGDLSDLDTTDKDCVVDAVNEVKGITDTLNSKIATLLEWKYITETTGQTQVPIASNYHEILVRDVDDSIVTIIPVSALSDSVTYWNGASMAYTNNTYQVTHIVNYNATSSRVCLEYKPGLTATTKTRWYYR